MCDATVRLPCCVAGVLCADFFRQIEKYSELSASGKLTREDCGKGVRSCTKYTWFFFKIINHHYANGSACGFCQKSTASELKKACICIDMAENKIRTTLNMEVFDEFTQLKELVQSWDSDRLVPVENSDCPADKQFNGKCVGLCKGINAVERIFLQDRCDCLYEKMKCEQRFWDIAQESMKKSVLGMRRSRTRRIDQLLQETKIA